MPSHTEEERKRRKQEQKQREQAGQKFIGEREKRASQAEQAGATLKQARQQATRDIEAGVPTQQRTVEDVQELRQEVTGELERQGAFEEVTPRKESLASQPMVFSKIRNIPIIGSQIAGLAGAGAIRQPAKSSLEIDPDDLFRSLKDPLVGETAREATLRQIRADAFRKGISQQEAFGSMLEGLPGIGAAARFFNFNLGELPSENAQTVLAEINKLKEAASTGQEKVRNGLEDPDFGLARAREMEENIASLEGRIQLLIISSPALNADNDEVNLIQEQILEAKEKVSRYRRASTFGLTAQLTGTGRIVPTDEQLFFELKGGNENG